MNMETGSAAGTKPRMSKKKKIILAVCAAVLVLAAILTALFTSRYIASTARLLRFAGTVQLQDESGGERTIMNNLRFQSGNALRTEAESLVSIGLDSSKIVTMNELSRTEFLKRGKMLQLHLTEGRLFFQVSKALREDESFDIRTSTMVVGIRGTSGYVSVDEDGRERLYVTDGTVHVVGTNPVTGETKEIDVSAGERITVYLFNDKTVDSIMFFLETVEEDELPSLIAQSLYEDAALLDKACAASGWDAGEILRLTEGSYLPAGSGQGVNVPVNDKDFRPVTTELILTAQSASKLYDGEPLTRPGEVLVEGLPEGFTIEAEAVGSQTDAGSSPNAVERCVIRDASGTDRSRYFLNVTRVDGMLTVVPVPVTIRTADAEKVYDGTPLTAEGVVIDGFVARQVLGAEDDAPRWQDTAYVYTDENGFESLLVLDGSVRVAGVNPLTREEEQQTIGAGEKLTVRLYGERDAASLVCHRVRLSEEELPEAVLRLLGSDAALLEKACEDAEWDIWLLRRLIAQLPAPAEDDPIHGFEGSLLDAPGYRECLFEGFAAMHLTVDTVAAAYTGQDLTRAELRFEPFAALSAPAVAVTGSQTDAGSSENSFTLDWSGLEQKNYDVTMRPGTLTVKSAPATVTTGSAAREYNGKELTEESAQIEGVIETGVTVTATGSQTDAGSSENSYTIDWGSVNRDNYELTEKLGTLTVYPAAVTVTTGSATRVYNGTALTNAEANITGLVETGVTVTATGSQTEVGSSQNTYTINWGNVDKDNYAVTENLGTLTVTGIPVTITTPGNTKIYDGTPLTTTYVAPTVTGVTGVTATCTGSQTNAGSSPNTYTIVSWGGNDPSHLEITENLGTLTVTPRPLTIFVAVTVEPGDYINPADITGLAPGETIQVRVVPVGPRDIEIFWGTVNPANYTVTTSFQH